MSVTLVSPSSRADQQKKLRSGCGVHIHNQTSRPDVILIRLWNCWMKMDTVWMMKLSAAAKSERNCCTIPYGQQIFKKLPKPVRHFRFEKSFSDNFGASHLYQTFTSARELKMPNVWMTLEYYEFFHGRRRRRSKQMVISSRTSILGRIHLVLNKTLTES